jgi:polysaccharide deacetylase 2 family uncharacterized protein YibQ
VDDLNAPLGQDKTSTHRKRRFRLPIGLPQAIVGCLGLFILTVVGWALIADDPLGGEPVAVVDNLSETPRNVAVPAAAETQLAAGPGAIAVTTPAMAAGHTVNIIDGSSGKSQQVVLPVSASPATADPRLLEKSRHGEIPRIATDGARPSTVYARPLRLPPGKAEAPRIAVIVTGLGISNKATDEALTRLPGTVTLAFTPYGSELVNLVARARQNGHEVLLQAPMEPFDYPDNDPGPQTLLTSLSADQNVDRLQWLMSRFQGFVGIANYMGARFTASEQALGPILGETAKRGLIFVDDGSSSRSVAGQIAGANNMPFAKADVVIDTVPTAAEIDRALARLEAQARERGVAVGVLSPLPIAITRVADWSKTIESRGFVLVPITAVAIKAKSS